jgi:hypothetical protein
MPPESRLNAVYHYPDCSMRESDANLIASGAGIAFRNDPDTDGPDVEVESLIQKPRGVSTSKRHSRANRRIASACSLRRPTFRWPAR